MATPAAQLALAVVSHVVHSNSAAQSVLNTVELLELILEELPNIDLVIATRTSNLWKNVVDGSMTLQKKLFLMADGNDAEVPLPANGLRFNRIFFKEGTVRVIAWTDNHGPHSGVEVQIRPAFRAICGDVDSPHSSYYEMLVTQPPRAKATLLPDMNGNFARMALTMRENSDMTIGLLAIGHRHRISNPVAVPATDVQRHLIACAVSDSESDSEDEDDPHQNDSDSEEDEGEVEPKRAFYAVFGGDHDKEVFAGTSTKHAGGVLGY